MGLRKTKETVVNNDIGEEVHVFDGKNGPARIKRISFFDRLYSGKQFCPDCRIEIPLGDDGVFTCPRCGYNIPVEEVEQGYGYPTLESIYDEDI